MSRIPAAFSIEMRDNGRRRGIQKLLLAPVLCGVLATGCASPTRWHVTDEAQFKRDNYECERDMHQYAAGVRSPYFNPHLPNWPLSRTTPAQAFYQRCMEAKGYQRAD